MAMIVKSAAVEINGRQIWMVALFTDHWVLVKVEESESTTHNSNFGLWNRCVDSLSPVVNPPEGRASNCSLHSLNFYLQLTEAQTNISVARTIIAYRRAVVALAVVSLLIISMALAFSCYTFRNARYTFKRLAAAIHVLTAATMMVLIQVVSGGVAYARVHVPSLHPEGSVFRPGYSYYLAWAAFGQFSLSGCVFLIYSRKRKTLGIVDEDGTPVAQDQPQIMGRN